MTPDVRCQSTGTRSCPYRVMRPYEGAAMLTGQEGALKGCDDVGLRARMKFGAVIQAL